VCIISTHGKDLHFDWLKPYSHGSALSTVGSSNIQQSPPPLLLSLSLFLSLSLSCHHSHAQVASISLFSLCFHTLRPQVDAKLQDGFRAATDARRRKSGLHSFLSSTEQRTCFPPRTQCLPRGGAQTRRHGRTAAWRAARDARPSVRRCGRGDTDARRPGERRRTHGGLSSGDGRTG
jgi:hypothetical protein